MKPSAPHRLYPCDMAFPRRVPNFPIKRRRDFPVMPPQMLAEEA